MEVGWRLNGGWMEIGEKLDENGKEERHERVARRVKSGLRESDQRERRFPWCSPAGPC